MWNRSRRSPLAMGLLLTSLLASVAGISGCLTSSRVAEMGDEEAKKIEASMGLVKDAKLVAYVNAVGQRLVALSELPAGSWSFEIVATPEPNAFALPGGHIYVSRGLLALVNSEDELAGVLGHEIGHVTADHTTKRLGASAAMAPLAIATGLAGAAVGIVSPALGNIVGGTGQALSTGLVIAPFSRSQENDADEIGQALAARAGYEPSALASFLHTLGREEKLQLGKERQQTIMDRHPMTPDRVRRLDERAPSLTKGPAKPVAKGLADLFSRLEGLVVGEDPVEGVFQDNRFLHPTFDISVAFPSGWKTVNTPEAAGAVSSPEDAVSALSVASGDSSLDELLKELAEADPNLVFRRLEINGLPAARVEVAQRGRSVHLTLIAHGGHVYSLVGRTTERLAKGYQRVFEIVAGSFGSLSSSDRNSIQESRLRVRRAEPGETPSGVSQRTGSTWNGGWLAVANAKQPGEKLAGGALLKVAIPQPFEAGNR